MFDLLGVFELGRAAESNVAVGVPHAKIKARLPSEEWAPAAAAQVERPRLQARFLEHRIGGSSYSSADGVHLFVVGDLFARGRHAIGPLPAAEVLAGYRHDSAAFLSGVKGNFVLVVVDESHGTCELLASRLSISPFYYTLDGTRVVFSTALVSLLTSLNQRRGLDRAAVAELALFNYPLGDRTYARDVKSLRPAEHIRVDAAGLHRQRWWDIRSLYELPRLPRAEALEMGSQLLHAAVNDLASDSARLRVSFTSGFDSRATLAVLEKDPSELLAYAFGIPGSINISIPLEICAQQNVPFAPIYLDRAYEERFDEYALRALVLSDCLSTVERANYVYAFERLADFSPVVLTGLFGSELLRTFQNVGHIVSPELVRLNLSAEPIEAVRRFEAQPSQPTYVDPDLLRAAHDDVSSDVFTVLVERFGDLSPDRRFYMFLFTEGLRKYFGAETHMERPWGHNRFPFLDEEFVEFAFRSPFAGVHARTLKPTVANRLRSQFFYSYVIRRYRAELLQATTDHGYSPGELLAPLALLRIGPKVLMQRQRHKRMGYREFKTEEWTEALYRRHLFQTTPMQGVFSEQLRGHFETGEWKTFRLEFARAASFKLWADTLDGLIGGA